VHIQQQHVALSRQLQQRCPPQRTLDQVEGQLDLRTGVAGERGVLGGGGQRAEVDERQGGGDGRADLLVGLTLADGKDGAQRLVTLDQGGQGSAEGDTVEAAVELDPQRDMVGRQTGAELFEEPQPLLRVGQRQPPVPRSRPDLRERSIGRNTGALEQRQDLRLWHGRVNLFDRIKAMRGYAWLTAGAVFASIGGSVASEGALTFGLIVPIYMSVKAWRRGKSLRESGLRLRRVLLMPRAKWVIPAPPPPPSERQLEKLAPREILESSLGAVIRRAAEDRAAILAIVAKLSKADRALLPDIVPTVNGLVERVAHLAERLHRLDQDIDPRLIEELDARISDAEKTSESSDAQRRLALLRRQRGTLEELVQRRAALAHQLDNAGLVLGSLRLDLLKLRSSGLQSALSDVSTATQEARALSREIGAALDAAAEVKSL
jgi:hypothetical protein